MALIAGNYDSPLANNLPIPVLRGIVDDVFGEESFIMDIEVLNSITIRINFDDPNIVNDVLPIQNPIRLIPIELNELQILISSKESCPICFDEYNMNNKNCEVFKNVCSHCFHVECLKKWLEVQNTCPMCRAEIM